MPISAGTPAAFGKKVAASDMPLMAALGAAGTPAKICASKVSWGEGGARERADDAFLQKKRRSKANFANGRPWAAGTPAKICEAKFRGEARSSRMSAR